MQYVLPRNEQDRVPLSKIRNVLNEKYSNWSPKRLLRQEEKMRSLVK